MSPVSPPATITRACARTRKTSIATTHLDQAALLNNYKTALDDYGSEAPNGIRINNEPSSGERRKFSQGELAKVAVSSLIGLALWDYNESDMPAGTPTAVKWLPALPFALIRVSMQHLHVSMSTFGQFLPPETLANIWAILKISVVRGAVMYALASTILAALNWIGQDKEVAVTISLAPPIPLTVDFPSEIMVDNKPSRSSSLITA